MPTRSSEQLDDTARVNRLWNLFALRSYARIVAVKHGLSVPIDDLDSLSDEEISSRLSLVRDMAHLPPG